MGRIPSACDSQEPKTLKQKYFDIFRLSMFDASPSNSLSNEKEEEGHVLGVLRKSLVSAGLLGPLTTRGDLGSQMRSL